MKQPIKTLMITAAALIFASSTSYAASCTNDTWNKVMKRGKMVVGVKADYKPWGFRDTSGAIVGMEADMAKMAADAMGVDVELVAVQSSNRMQFLENGKIDLMIATMSDRVDRRKLVGITQPNYYTSGTNIMSPKGVGIKKWKDLRGKPVCGKQGAFYNKVVADRYGGGRSGIRLRRVRPLCADTLRDGLPCAAAASHISTECRPIKFIRLQARTDFPQVGPV